MCSCEPRHCLCLVHVTTPAGAQKWVSSLVLKLIDAAWEDEGFAWREGAAVSNGSPELMVTEHPLPAHLAFQCVVGTAYMFAAEVCCLCMKFAFVCNCRQCVVALSSSVWMCVSLPTSSTVCARA